MDYTLNQLRIFLKIAQHQSITKAAADLHLTQPAVSIQLKNFQQQFDIPLTEVVGKRLFITDFGKEIALSAEQILNEVYAINYKTVAYQGQLSGRLRVSIASTAKYLIPYFLGPFLKRHPEIELLLDVTNKSRVVENLENNEVDFSLVSVLPLHLNLTSLELMPNQLFLVGNAGDELPRSRDPQQVLTNIPLIFREQGSATRRKMERFLDHCKVTMRKKMELTSNAAIKQAILAGLGYSIMPLIGLKNELTYKQLQIIPLDGLPLENTWRLVWLSEKKLSPAATAFLQFSRQHRHEIIQSNFGWITHFSPDGIPAVDYPH
jgi:DNA-binding transcriptional LysR family regulator